MVLNRLADKDLGSYLTQAKQSKKSQLQKLVSEKELNTLKRLNYGDS